MSALQHGNARSAVRVTPVSNRRCDPTVALGTLVTAAFVLNLHDRLANLAAPALDEIGLSLDEQRLPKRIRRKKA